MRRTGRWIAGLVCLTGMVGRTGILARTMTAQEAGAKQQQQPADAKAYAAARKMSDPAAKLAALQQFLAAYPKSTRVGRAREAVLQVLLDSFPDRAREIDTQAKLIVHSASKGRQRQYEESDLAEKLARAGSDGVDLKLAEKYATDVSRRTEEKQYDADQVKLFHKFGVAAPKPDALHRRYAKDHADALATLALVYLKQGRQEEAQRTVAQAEALDPRVDEVQAVRGEVALAHGDKAEALAAFEQASLLGSLDARDRRQMMLLFREAHGDSDAAFEGELDAQYARLFPEEPSTGKHTASASGHTVLLSLFTGSACPPCVGGDLAVEQILRNYPRTEVVALALDQHIPEPDPLANPDSIAVAQEYKVSSTPNYVLDGQKIELYGGGREDSASLYGKLAGLLDKELATSSGVTLTLTGQEQGGKVAGKAVVTMAAAAVLAAQVLRKVDSVPAPDPDAPRPATDKKKSKAPAAKPAAPARPAAPAVAVEEPSVPEYLVNVALVEDEVRYSGENGVRFHRMVVRALLKPAGDGSRVLPGETTTIEAKFDPAAISRTLGEYLTRFEAGNDRFDKFEFISKDTAMDPRHLALAAWVEDKNTHRVLQAGFVPVGAAQ